mmetsp:Transcript_117959/g.263773  ORF Transcript_117959/g.263773 Transcript_117959/m.263773 type:complete len:666 (+) Transcript_117959:94-2091(+)
MRASPPQSPKTVAEAAAATTGVAAPSGGKQVEHFVIHSQRGGHSMATPCRNERKRPTPSAVDSRRRTGVGPSSPGRRARPTSRSGASQGQWRDDIAAIPSVSRQASALQGAAPQGPEAQPAVVRAPDARHETLETDEVPQEKLRRENEALRLQLQALREEQLYTAELHSQVIACIVKERNDLEDKLQGRHGRSDNTSRTASEAIASEEIAGATAEAVVEDDVSHLAAHGGSTAAGEESSGEAPQELGTKYAAARCETLASQAQCWEMQGALRRAILEKRAAQRQVRAMHPAAPPPAAAESVAPASSQGPPPQQPCGPSPMGFLQQQGRSQGQPFRSRATIGGGDAAAIFAAAAAASAAGVAGCCAQRLPPRAPAAAATNPAVRAPGAASPTRAAAVQARPISALGTTAGHASALGTTVPSREPLPPGAGAAAPAPRSWQPPTVRVLPPPQPAAPSWQSPAVASASSHGGAPRIQVGVLSPSASSATLPLASAPTRLVGMTPLAPSASAPSLQARRAPANAANAGTAAAATHSVVACACGAKAAQGGMGKLLAQAPTPARARGGSSASPPRSLTPPPPRPFPPPAMERSSRVASDQAMARESAATPSRITLTTLPSTTRLEVAPGVGGAGSPPPPPPQLQYRAGSSGDAEGASRCACCGAPQAAAA